MSIIPANAMILSKMKFLLKEKFSDDPELLEKILLKVGPFHLFKIHVKWRSLVGNAQEGEFDTEELERMIGDINLTDDSDKACNAFTRVRKAVKESWGEGPRVYRVSLIYAQETRSDDVLSWGDIWLDEFPVNVSKITVENEKEITPNKDESDSTKEN